MSAADARILRFSGEESARFTRFGLLCLAHSIATTIRITGREPLTSRPVKIEGRLVSGTLDGYMRLLVVEEAGSTVQYWIAGSNATRSIAANIVEFDVDQTAQSVLNDLVASGEYVPGLMIRGSGVEAEWIVLEECLEARTEQGLATLLELLKTAPTPELAREIALAVRAFATVATRRRALQRSTERALLDCLETTTDTDTRIAMVEDLGYVGSRISLEALGRMLSEPSEPDHVRWAAAVALGRLNIREATPYLRVGAYGEHMWTRAACLLALARRAEEPDRREFESLFIEALSSPDPTLQRYACLGLSKFSAVEDSTLAALRGLLENADLPLNVRGYGALALSSVVSQCSVETRTELAAAFERLSFDGTAEVPEPETVWGLEFLAELATLLELHEHADDLYSELAELFDDWRSPYYEALALYERGELAISERSELELRHYDNAIEILRAIDTSERDAEQAVSFRLDIVKGRRQLQQALKDWENTFEAAQLDALAGHLREVAAVFARYGAGSAPHLEGVKRLSDREREYLNGTRRLVEVMSNVISLEATWRRGASTPDGIRALVRNLSDVLLLLSEQFRGQLARGPLKLAQDASEKVEDTLSVLENVDVADGLRERSVQALTSDLRTLFRGSTWPMPARACPVGGLGRGRLSVVAEDIPGSGAEEDPFRFPPSSPPVMNILVEIEEMAPGGATRARVHCEVAGQQLPARTIHAVEGPVRCDFVLPELSPVASSVCRFELIFEARDCSQPAGSLAIYARAEMTT